MNYFLLAQGIPIQRCIIYQDNQSAILLEVNGRASAGQRSRHMNIKYFFITDRINKKECEIKYCPTNQMIADHLTKPLQGQLFRSFRSILMNVDPSIPDAYMSLDRSCFAKSRRPSAYVISFSQPARSSYKFPWSFIIIRRYPPHLTRSNHRHHHHHDSR